MFTPENALEQALVLASTELASHPEFYKQFAASQIFVPSYGPPVSNQDGPMTLPSGTKLEFQAVRNGDRELLPIFSSLPRLQAFLTTEVKYLEMAVMEFLRLTQGAGVVLNPGSDYGKEFTPPEIASILDGSLWQPAKPIVTEKETQVLLGQPADYPHALTGALSKLFKNLKDVESAYLAHIHNPDQAPPHTLIGIQAAGNWDNIVAQAGIVLNGVDVPSPQ